MLDSSVFLSHYRPIEPSFKPKTPETPLLFSVAINVPTTRFNVLTRTEIGIIWQDSRDGLHSRRIRRVSEREFKKIAALWEAHPGDIRDELKELISPGKDADIVRLLDSIEWKPQLISTRINMSGTHEGHRFAATAIPEWDYKHDREYVSVSVYTEKISKDMAKETAETEFETVPTERLPGFRLETKFFSLSTPGKVYENVKRAIEQRYDKDHVLSGGR